MYLEVYPDIIFILNFCFDFLLLFLLKKVNKKNSSFLRMVLSACIGALTAVIICIFPWMHLLLQIVLMYGAVALMMIVVAFGLMKPAELLKQFIVLNLITYFVGGFVNSIYYRTRLRMNLLRFGKRIDFSNIPWVFVGGLFVLIVPTALFIIRWLNRYRSNKAEIFDVELVLEDRQIRTKGLLDTGNCLRDPLYKKPVMIVENYLLEQLLSPDFIKELKEARMYLERNELDAERWKIGTESMMRLRFIPYSSVGKSGMLLGIKLDKVFINTGKETVCHERVTAAFCDNRLSSKDEYHVLLHKELL